MEALRQDDPRRCGPYTVLARLRETASAVQYLADDAAGGRAVVITAARPGLAALPAFRRRFQAEARTADRLSGGWVQPRLDLPADDTDEDGLLWTAEAYVPALTLTEAIGTAGPLPEHAVRILGAGLAETLSRVHAGGTVLQGLAPRTVLLAEDGPRLAAFGPLGAAAAAESRAGGQLSVRLGYLTPEQVEGEEPGPASDLFVLGLLLAYAATGSTPLAGGPAEEAADRIAHTDPELDAVPEELRDLVGRCLAKDPSERPGAGTVAAELALEGAAGLAKGGWLPRPLLSALTDQAARARWLRDSGGGAGTVTDPADAPPAEPAHTGPAEPADALPLEAPGEAPESAEPAIPSPSPALDSMTAQLGTVAPRPPGSDRPTTQLSIPHERTGPPDRLPALRPPTAPLLPYAPPAGPPPGPPAAASAPASRPAPDVGRRNLLLAATAGVAGLVVGGGGVLALGSDDSAGDDDAKPAPTRGAPVVAGLPPRPRWVYTHPASEPPPLTTALWQDRLLVLTTETQAAAVDLRTGRRVWENADAAKGQAALPAGKDLCFVAGPSEFLWLSAKDGRIAHRSGHTDAFTRAPGLKLSEIVGSSGAVVWITGAHTETVKAPKPKKGKKRGKDKQVVLSHLFAYDLERREELWRAPVPTGRGPAAPVHRLIGIGPKELVVRESPATLAPQEVRSAKGKAVFRGFDRASGKLLWTRSFGTVAPDAAAAADDRGVLYAAAGDRLQAFEVADGKPKWTLNGPEDSGYGTPVPAGALLHTTSRNQEVGAAERATGRLRWRRSTEAAAGDSAPAIRLSASGKTLLAADRSQVTAFSAAEGRRLWKFQDIGAQDPKGPAVTAPYRVLVSGASAVVQRDRIFYAFPVA